MMFKQPMLWDLSDAISSEVSAVGSLPLSLPDGLDPVGQALAPANPTRQRAKAKATTTPATSGLKCSGSSESVARPSCSENKSPAPQSSDLLVKVRTCKKCGIEKPYSEFYVNSKGNRGKCKECTKGLERQHKRKNPEATAARYKTWRDDNRGYALVNVAKHRAKQRGMGFNLEPADIQKRIDAGLCELSGISFGLSEPRAWNAPSLDRIDSTKGYTTDNVRVVLYALNVMANTWGPGKILEIASAISSRRKEASNTLSERIAANLKQKLQSGSTEYAETWKEKATPLGRTYWAHTASGHRTSGSDCTGWPSPRVQDCRGERPETIAIRKAKGNDGGYSSLCATAFLAGDAGSLTQPNAVLDASTTLAGWNTPRVTDGSNGGPNQTGGALPADAALAGWATPTASEKVRSEEFSQGREPSPREALAGWATPAHRDYRYPNGESYQERSGTTKGEQLNNQAVHHGPIPSSSPAETGKPGASVLNPAMSRWLMGFPATFDHCSPYWKEWDTVQRKLRECSGDREAFSRWLVEIALDDSGAWATQSSPK